MAVRIVTDSTSDIPADLARSLDVTVVAQNVHLGTKTFKDNVTITPDDFYLMLVNSPELPKTSQASPGEFKEAYDRLGACADAIVSIHVSSKLSGTCNSARLGAAQSSATCPIEVIDSAQASMALGLVVVASAAAAKQGITHHEVVSTARDSVARAQCFCLFQTLEYLQKGGRLGRAQALLGSALNIKPMIMVRNGEVTPLGKARTFQRALVKMEETARGFAPVDALAVMYSTTPEVAQQVADDLKDMMTPGVEPYITRFGPALGCYAGPGAIGIALLQSTA